MPPLAAQQPKKLVPTKKAQGRQATPPWCGDGVVHPLNRGLPADISASAAAAKPASQPLGRLWFNAENVVLLMSSAREASIAGRQAWTGLEIPRELGAADEYRGGF